ncbi:hypothetical protein F2P56_022410 [Juglans regia]|uniref:Uncharacterized protein n=2 Tax=Juglans regia TaxID=51240 RepID=A0A833WNP3_JUGRE|nr:calcium-dependent protein kinase 27-like [Juglans regia]KAF5458378.1 hypothetical protein F2P56_022410 [Juglans regia]
MCYVGKATKIFIFVVTVLVVLGLVLGFGLLRHPLQKTHKCSGDSCRSVSSSPIPIPNPIYGPPSPPISNPSPDPSSSSQPSPPNPNPSPPPPDYNPPPSPPSPPPPTLAAPPFNQPSPALVTPGPVNATQSQTARKGDNEEGTMEARLMSMEEIIRKLMEEIGMLHQENATLRRTNEDLVRGGELSANKHAYSLRAPTDAATEEERRKMHLQIRKPGKKCVEMAKKIDTKSTVEQLIASTDLPYNVGVMTVPLPTKFKVPQMEM